MPVRLLIMVDVFLLLRVLECKIEAMSYNGSRGSLPARPLSSGKGRRIGLACAHHSTLPSHLWFNITIKIDEIQGGAADFPITVQAHPYD
jgi:hypothetical protein